MDILFLGTSAGAPSRQRNVTGLALLPDQGSKWYLVDCGESTQHQLLNTSLSVHDLQAIFITHVHGDHCYGLPGLLSSAAMNGRKTPLYIVAPAAIEGWLKATQAMSESFLPFDVHYIAVEQLNTQNNSWQDQAVRVDTTLLSHRVPSYAYRFTEINVEAVLDSARLQAAGIPPGPLWGQLKRGLDIVHEGRTISAVDYLHHPYPPRSIIVGGDNDQPELLRAACASAQVLVHEATYTVDVAERVGDRVQHSSAAAVAAFAASVNLPNLVLTHFSARYQADPERSPCISDIEAEARAHYPGQLFLAEDFARLRLSKSGELSRIV
ncbi:ribonuclease Z [Undibacterium sp. TS12]|uniref:ribonuclease Z n=1 Tax=Undibacterium sp. TS12 TaxID=2908202 RepID=UPI001F4CA6FC|nr:ribonuclease Z [Undibacterium sp. TS12]MCH8622355.1 ribonuclease Z [Undibacterium sp. TS12]